ncbi:MAG: alpha/beta hydrolase [Anaerolineaceae bacterium]|nr:MAG: alpha/beta hydrolase [Anaerolineaceae bacterium]
MPYIATNEGQLYYADHRKADSTRTPVIFVHGAGGSRLDWPPELRRLPAANAIALDLPGHGNSPSPGRSDILDYARVVLALMDALEIKEAIICGHSMGGGIAQTVALIAPERTRGIILIGTGAKLRVHPDILNRVREQKADVVTLLQDWIWADPAPPDAKENAYHGLMNTPADVIYGDYLACDSFDIREQLGGIRAPALIFAGSADLMTPHKFGEYLAQNIPHAQLVTISNGGHMMALEQPQKVASVVGQWLDSAVIRGTTDASS